MGLPLFQEAAALWRARALLWVMARRELAARHAGTALGIAWPYIQPLLTVAAYYLVFDVVFAMRLGEQAPTRAVGTYLIVGMLPWMAFCEALSRGMNSLVEAGSVLQKNALPPALFVARSVLASAVVHAPLMLALALAYTPHHRFALALVALLPLLALLAAALRDTVQLVGFALSVGLFLSPVLFPVTMFPAQWRWALWANPMTPLLTGYQSILLEGTWPRLSAWLAACLWCALGAWVLDRLLRRSRDQLVDWL